MSNDQTHLYAVAKREILKGGGNNFHTLFKRFFGGRTNLKLIETQKRGPGGMFSEI